MRPVRVDFRVARVCLTRNQPERVDSIRDAGFGFANLAAFVDALVFNFIVGNADAHAKNFSIIYRNGGSSLAPLYDTLSTVVYPSLTSRMAMSIGGAWEFNDVTVESFDAFALKCDINPKFVRERIAKIADGLAPALDDTAVDLESLGMRLACCGRGGDLVEYAQ